MIIGFLSFGFLVVWFDNAYLFETSAKVQNYVSGNNTILVAESFNIENYLPWEFSLELHLRYYHHNHSTRELIWKDEEELIPYYQTLCFEPHDVSQVTYYGDKTIEVSPIIYESPRNFTNFTYFPIKMNVPPFTKVVTTVQFSYYSDDIPLSYGIYFADARERLEAFSDGFFMNPRIRVWTQIWRHVWFTFSFPNPLNILIPAILFLISGLGYAYIVKDDLNQIISSIQIINQLMQKGQVSSPKIKESLTNLAHYTNLIDDGPAIFITPATTLLKMNLRRKVTKLYHINKIHSSDGADLFNMFLEDDSTKPANTLLEFRVIALLVGLMASLGFTFTWNFNAIRPFLVAMCLLILCFNFGFLFYLFKKSPSDIRFVIYLFVFAIMIMIFEHEKWSLTSIAKKWFNE